jgi:hypothetical protein
VGEFFWIFIRSFPDYHVAIGFLIDELLTISAKCNFGHVRTSLTCGVAAEISPAFTRFSSLPYHRLHPERRGGFSGKLA